MKISNKYWDSILPTPERSAGSELWRFPVYTEYQKLIDYWSETHRLSYVLKTDLYEEATASPGLMGFFKHETKLFVGIDQSFQCVALARKKLKKTDLHPLAFVCCDIRQLPFKPCFFDLVISNSTLDHFTAKKHIIHSLQEICFITKKGGLLILTLDNPLNPLIFIRNILPYRLLKTLQLIPYFMGSLVPRGELVKIMKSVGFSIINSSYIAHCPRLIIFGAERFLSRIGKHSLLQSFIRIMNRFEALKKMPVQSFTAQFIMVSAKKNNNNQ